ncbi:MAG: PA2779 family protein [Betaproteobacteria bacterium]
MKISTTRILCRLLAALMIWMPYHAAQAGMIGTEQALAAKTDRAALVDLVARADVSSRLQALGVDPAQARARIASMTEEEIASLAGQVDSLPAGAISNGGAILLILLVALVTWWFWGRR